VYAKKALFINDLGPIYTHIHKIHGLRSVITPRLRLLISNISNYKSALTAGYGVYICILCILYYIYTY